MPMLRVHFLQDCRYQKQIFAAGEIIELDDSLAQAILEENPEALAIEKAMEKPTEAPAEEAPVNKPRGKKV